MFVNKHISRAHISKSKRCFNVKSSTYYFHIKTKILADFLICIIVPLSLSLVHARYYSSIILLYNKEAVSRTLCRLSASASRVAATALYNLPIVFLGNIFFFLIF